MSLQQSLENVYKLPVGSLKKSESGTKSRMNMNVFPENYTAPLLPERMNMNVFPENYTAPLLPERMNMNVAPESMNTDADPSLRVFIEDLANQISETDDPDQKAILNKNVEKFELDEKAPLADLAELIRQAGTGEDTVLAHLAPGEVILPGEFMEDEQLESMIEAKFDEVGIKPEEYVAGIGIASLNQMTGLQEFGFFKKLGRSLEKIAKKVIKPVAKVAQFIPGPWQPIAAMANKAFTVYDVAKGRASPLALASAFAPLPGGADAGKGLSSFGKIKEFFTKGADDVGFLGNVGKTLSGAGEGIAGLISGGGADNIGRFGRLGDFLGGTSGASGGIAGLIRGGGADNTGSFGRIGDIFSGGGIDNKGSFGRIGDFFTGAVDPEKEFTYYDPVNEVIVDKRTGREYVPPEITTTDGNFFSKLISGGGADNKGNFGTLGDILGGGLGGGADGGGLGGLGSLAKLGLAGTAAAKLGQLAMEEARKDRGVPLTPLTTMDAAGRYNIEAEIARRMGLPAPNPVEFGLMPRFPALSGAQSGARREAVISPYVQQAAMGGAIMPMMYAEGGAVAMQEGGEMNPNEFPRMDGDINGPGTETSDDIPAMLSDGEFVMTGRAVRGAGSFELNEEPNGILTLVPSASESREKGTQLMYKMMDVFGRYADATS